MATKDEWDKNLKNVMFELQWKARDMHDFDKEENMKDFAKKYHIDLETVQKFFSDAERYEIYKRKHDTMEIMAKNYPETGVSLHNEISRAKSNFDKSKSQYLYDINMISLQYFASEIPDYEVSIEFIEYLKERNANQNIIKGVLDKFVSNVKLEANNEEENQKVMAVLYENGYKPQGNTPVDLAYNYYSECREKDKHIESLEMEVTDIEGILCDKIDRIKALKKEVSYCEQVVPNMLSKINECAEKAKNSADLAKEAKGLVEYDENRGILKKVFNKIFTIFKKEKPSFADLFGKMQWDISAVAKSLDSVRENVTRPDTYEKTVKSIQPIQRNRQMEKLWESR